MLKSVIADLEAMARDRREKYDTVVTDDFLDPRLFQERIVTGTFSQTWMNSRRRFIREQSAVMFYPGLQETPPTIARDYLDIAYPRKPRCTGEQAELFAQCQDLPLYCEPLVCKDGVYVDLHSAYWTLLGIIGWDVDYHPAKYLSPGRAPYDFPLPENKLARNSLVSAAQSTSMQVWTGYKFISEAPYNKHLNRGLFRAITDILQQVARDALVCGASYIATDGYIFEANKANYFIELLENRWLLPWTIKGRGPTIVTGVGSYRVGELRTKRFRPASERPISNVVDRSDNLIKSTFPMIARDRLDRPYRFKP